jgi:hypothetical protein
MDGSENNKSKANLLVVLTVATVIGILIWESDHRYDKEIEHCMREKLPDYKDYKSCNLIGGDTCQLYEYDKQECRRKVKEEAALKNQ